MYRRSIYAALLPSFLWGTLFIGSSAAFDDAYRTPDHPILVVRQTRELGISSEQIRSLAPLLDYKREETSACFDEWVRVQEYPKTEIRLTMQKWIRPRAASRREMRQLVRQALPENRRERYDELLFQVYIYAGEFYYAAELIGEPIGQQQTSQLAGLQKEAHAADGELRSLLTQLEVELLANEGVRIDPGAPFRAIQELESARTPRVTLKIDEYWAKLQHPAAIAELSIGKRQFSRLQAIAKRHGLKLHEEIDPDAPPFGLFPPMDDTALKRRIAIGKQAMQELDAALTDEQRLRFQQIRYQCLMEKGKRTEALAVFGFQNPTRRKHDNRPVFVDGIHTAGEPNNTAIDRVKRTFAADYAMVRNRERFAQVIPVQQIDKHMGKLSSQILDTQASYLQPPNLRFMHGPPGGPPKGTQPRDRTAKMFGRLSERAGSWYADAICTR